MKIFGVKRVSYWVLFESKETKIYLTFLGLKIRLIHYYRMENTWDGIYKKIRPATPTCYAVWAFQRGIFIDWERKYINLM